MISCDCSAAKHMEQKQGWIVSCDFVVSENRCHAQGLPLRVLILQSGGMKFQPDGKVHQLLKVSSVRKYTVVTKVELYNETPSLLKALLNECVK